MSKAKLHSRMPPSAAERTYNCPGWIKLAERIDAVDHSSDAATEGTLAHHAGFIGITQTPNLNYYVNHKLPPDEDYEGLDKKITQEMAEYVQGYVDYVINCTNAMRDTYGEALLVAHYEKRVHALDLHKDAHGTPDAVVGAQFNELHIIDLKYGVAPVSANHNMQLLTYAGYAIEEYGDFNKVCLHIYQPRIKRKNPVSRSNTNSRYVKKFLKKMIQKMNVADKGTKKYKAGSWCFFCPCRSNACPEHAKKQLDNAVEVFGEWIE